MLVMLAEWVGQDLRGVNLFGYITLRTVRAAMTALIISFVAGPRVIRWLAAKKIGQAVRQDGPQTHIVKTGTPTMGGVLGLTLQAPAAAEGAGDVAARPFIDLLVAVRGDLRVAKQWALSDKIRNELKGLGVVIDDTPEGAKWRFEQES